jgi:hypothetical protein
MLYRFKVGTAHMRFTPIVILVNEPLLCLR